MKHNLILGWICCLLSGVVTLIVLAHGGRDFTSTVILFVATMYFAGRHMDKHHD